MLDDAIFRVQPGTNMSAEYFWVTVSDKAFGCEANAEAESLEGRKEVSFKVFDG